MGSNINYCPSDYYEKPYISTMAAQRQVRTQGAEIQGGPPAKRLAGGTSGGDDMAPAAPHRAQAGTAGRPSRRGRAGSASPTPRMTAEGSTIIEARETAIVPRPANSAAGDKRREDRGSSGRTEGRAESSRTVVSHTGPAKAVQKTAGGYAARKRGRMEKTAEAMVTRPGRLSSEEEKEMGQ